MELTYHGRQGGTDKDKSDCGRIEIPRSLQMDRQGRLLEAVQNPTRGIRRDSIDMPLPNLPVYKAVHHSRHSPGGRAEPFDDLEE
jgi:hypothetical protein